MDTPAPGDLVTIAAGRPLDGIVFTLLSGDRATVAAIDHVRGPGFRTVALAELSERTEAGPGDKALQQLIRRTPVPAGHAASSAAGVRNRGAAHNRAPAHRATGK